MRSKIRVIDFLPNRPVGLVDTDVAELFGIRARVLNQAVKRNITRFPNIEFMFQMTKSEYEHFLKKRSNLKKFKYRRYIPYVYTFKGICLVASSMRLNLPSDVKSYVLNLFNKKTFSEFDLGYKKPEKIFEDKIKTIFAGVARIKKQYKVPCGRTVYFVDFYFPEYNIAIEIDETQHRWSYDRDLRRQNEITNKLDCDFIRLDHSEDFDKGVNHILRSMFSRDKNGSEI